MKKKIIILVCVIILVLSLGYIFRYPLGNALYNIQMSFINEDLKVKIQDTKPLTPGGYATSTRYYIVDFEKKILLEVHDYNVYGVTSAIGEEGSHWSITEYKFINDSEVEKIKNSKYLENTLHAILYN